MLEQYRILRKIQETSSSNEKQGILESNKNDELLKEILEFVYNPYFRTGLSTKKINKKLPPTEYRLMLNQSDSITYMFKYLKDHNTGTDSDISQVQWYIRNYSEGEPELVKEILSQTLKIGMTAKSINKVWKDLIPEFDVMKAEKYWEKIDKLEQEKPEIIITQKLDGMRCLTLKTGNEIKMLSRSGQEMTGMFDVENELRKLPDGAYDGELIVDLGKNNSLESFSDTVSTIRTKDKKKENVIYNIFDYVSSVTEFVKDSFTENCKTRKNNVEQILRQGFQYLRYVPVLYSGIYDGKVVDDLLNKAISLKQEGLMINLADAPYSKKRTNDILKVKQMYTMDLKVTGVFEGKGKYKSTLGGVYVDFKGNNVGVGSGFDDTTRKYVWDDPNRIVGKIVEVQYFEVSKDKKTGTESLRFPIYKGIRMDKDEISFD